MHVDFKITALFSSPYSRVKKRGNFKTNIRLVSVKSFLYHLSSSLDTNQDQNILDPSSRGNNNNLINTVILSSNKIQPNCIVQSHDIET